MDGPEVDTPRKGQSKVPRPHPQGGRSPHRVSKSEEERKAETAFKTEIML